MSPRLTQQRIETRILQRLARAAERRQPCPTNNELADAAGIMSAGAASEAVSRLAKQGKIIVERGPSTRVVTIIETGKRTAGTITAPHWRDVPGQRSIARKHAPRPDVARRRLAADITLEAKVREKIDIAARIERDQAARRAERERWLDLEQRRYALPRRARLIDEMPA